MKELAQQVHQEVLGLISALSDDSSSDTGSLVSKIPIVFPNY
jgi:hypothetical protein